MEFVIENYRLRATEDGRIERFWKANKKKPDRWTEIKGKKNNRNYLHIELYLTSRQRNFLIHRLVYLAHHQDWDIYDTKQLIDHGDRNRSNNRIGNLTVVTHEENTWNTDAKGYSWCEKTQKWRSMIRYKGKLINLGGFYTEEEARQAYLDAKAIYHVIEEKL